MSTQSSIPPAPQPYADFLSSKALIAPTVGRDVPPESLHPALFPFQADVTRWGVRKGRAAFFQAPGLGKTFEQLEWARLILDGIEDSPDVPRCLVITPLSVALQTVAEGERWGIPVAYRRIPADLPPRGIVVTTYEMSQNFDPGLFSAVVLDECFAAGTPVDTPSGRKYIQNIRIGDEILNASGVDIVSDVHRREVSFAVRISVNGERITSSPNHPYFTRRGWVCAQDLQPGDSLVAAGEAVRMVRDTIPQEVGTAASRGEILRSILLSEMADEPAGTHRQGPHARGCPETRRQETGMVCVRQSEGARGDRAGEESQSVVRSGRAREDIPHVEGHAPSTFRAWGQRAWIDYAAGDLAGCARSELAGGISFVVGQADSRLSHALQARLGASRTANQHRGGWTCPSRPQGNRCQERRETRIARVDRLEILELGHPDLERFREAGGKLYFYDLGATRHPSYSVAGLLVHNSSILKAQDGKTRTRLIRQWSRTPYRLCCSATPAPNDHAELANHAEFLGVMSRTEMLATFFVHDDKGWRLKGHAHGAFYKWLSSWAMAMDLPSNLGYSDDGYILPPLEIVPEIIPTDWAPPGQLFPTTLKGITERATVRRDTADRRVVRVAELIDAEPAEPWIVWCGLNVEQDMLAAVLGDRCISIYGSLSPDEKESRMAAWLAGERPVLLSKVTVCGFGLNLQHCARMAFLGLGDSWEQYFQAIRRCWRFGQQRPVRVHVVLTTPEEPIYRNVLRKEAEATRMTESLISQASEYEKAELGSVQTTDTYREDVASGERWTMHLGDSAEVLESLPDDSIDLSVYSPPFGSLYTYSASERDLGNSRDDAQFFAHYAYILDHLLRVTKPGRVTAVHVADTPAMLTRDGYIGLKDFSGDVIRLYVARGWTFDARIPIDKNQQAQSIRTHSKALTMSQLERDRSWLRPALPDYILKFRKPGDNAVPVVGGDLTRDEWIEYASPTWPGDGDRAADAGAFNTWYGIRETDTLNVQRARSEEDERHIAPLQFGTIARCIRLWSNRGETVLSPFAGIGSELYQAIKLGRKGIGVELNARYFRVACDNLRDAERQVHEPNLLDAIAAAPG